MKSASANVGALRLADLCRELEAGSRSGDGPFDARVAAIEAEYQRVREQLEACARGPAVATESAGVPELAPAGAGRLARTTSPESYTQGERP
jgi:HPt (histidine-containing phosphotransfer) domain-containing protein